MLKVPRVPGYSANRERTQHKDGYPCVVCGRIVPQPRWMVHLHDGGAVVVTEKDAARLNPLADLGMYPLHKRCLQDHPELRRYARRQPGD